MGKFYKIFFFINYSLLVKKENYPKKQAPKATVDFGAYHFCTRKNGKYP